MRRREAAETSPSPVVESPVVGDAVGWEEEEEVEEGAEVGLGEGDVEVVEDGVEVEDGEEVVEGEEVVDEGEEVEVPGEDEVVA